MWAVVLPTDISMRATWRARCMGRTLTCLERWRAKAFVSCGFSQRPLSQRPLSQRPLSQRPLPCMHSSLPVQYPLYTPSKPPLLHVSVSRYPTVDGTLHVLFNLDASAVPCTTRPNPAPLSSTRRRPFDPKAFEPKAFEPKALGIPRLPPLTKPPLWRF